MRGAEDHLSIGERIAPYRARGGLTRAALAGLVGRDLVCELAERCRAI